jgi:hypothetical protein
LLKTSLDPEQCLSLKYFSFRKLFCPAPISLGLYNSERTLPIQLIDELEAAGIPSFGVMIMDLDGLISEPLETVFILGRNVRPLSPRVPQSQVDKLPRQAPWALPAARDN